MTRPTFYQWLRHQGDAPGRRGKAARWILADGCWPTRAKTLSHMLVHLRHDHAGAADTPTESDLRVLYGFYEAFRQGDEELPKREPRGDVHRGYLLPPDIPKKIAELARHRGETQGAFIAGLVNRAYRRAFGRPQVS